MKEFAYIKILEPSSLEKSKAQLTTDLGSLLVVE